jgi:tRNA 2-selenouridine synthase
MFKDITIQELLQMKNKEEHTLVDVRSPKEYHDATIPGSINIPIFDNDERAEIGTIYKQKSPEAAKDRGLEIFSQKSPAFIKAFQSIQTPFTVFCWRGGMRSKTAITVLDLMDIHANRLQDGFRSYRKWVMSELEKESFHPKLYVLDGFTGTGKTELLNMLDRNGYPVINLEKTAGHRGSIFGQIGMRPNNQKSFDSLLVHDLLRFKNEPFVFIEGESKRIGKACLPDFLYRKIGNGIHFMIQMPMEERVKNILREYEPGNNPEKFLEAFQYVKKRIHIPIREQIEQDLNRGVYESPIRLLLAYYYDPRYEHANQRYAENKTICLNAENVEDAYAQLIEVIKNQVNGFSYSKIR